MKAGASIFFLFLSLVLYAPANAQTKAKSIRKPSAKMAASPPAELPPPVTPMQASDLLTFDTTAAVEDAYTADIRRLMNVMSYKENLVRTIGGALDQNVEQLPPSIRGSFKQRFLKEFMEGQGMYWMENLFIKSYRKTFSQDEIKELISFYQTPLGKKFIDKSPELTLGIMQEAQKIGQYVGFKVGQDLDNETKKDKQ